MSIQAVSHSVTYWKNLQAYASREWTNIPESIGFNAKAALRTHTQTAHCAVYELHGRHINIQAAGHSNRCT